MKLWFLYRLLPAKPGETISLVIRAQNMSEARIIASNTSRSEGGDTWLDPAISGCERLLTTGNSHFILREVKPYWEKSNEC
jgi:hypothetical protein